MPPLAKNLLLALVSTTLFLTLIEAGSRYWRPTQLPTPLPGFKATPDPALFFRMAPNAMIKGGVGRTNSRGLRGPEIAEKSADEFRVLSLGESTTFGWKVHYGQAYSALLERKVTTVDGRRLRVVNAGAPAYTSFQGLVFLRTEGLALRPDAVLWYFGANDFTPASFRTQRSAPWMSQAAVTDRQQFERQRRPLARLSTLLLRYSNAYRALALRLRGGSLAEAPPVVGTAPRVPEDDRRWVLEQVRDLCAERHLRLVVVIPWYAMFQDHISLLRTFARDHHLTVVDLPARLHDVSSAVGTNFLDRIHPNPNGHRLIAAEIAAVLRDQWPDAR
jgi:lysophospholipase L1-like esterase